MAGSGGSAASVDEVFGILGDVELDDPVYVWEVDASGHDVGA